MPAPARPPLLGPLARTVPLKGSHFSLRRDGGPLIRPFGAPSPEGKAFRRGGETLHNCHLTWGAGYGRFPEEGCERSDRMEKFIPYEKLSKKRKRELDAMRRGSWGGLNPVTRKPKNPRAYDRRKAQSWKKDPGSAPFVYSLV